MGLLFASGGLGGLIMPPVISWIIIGSGWRSAWVYLAAIHAVLAVILSGIIIRNKPEDMGLVPEGYSKNPQEGGTAGPPRHSVFQTSVDWRLRDAMRTPTLWMLVVLFTVILFVMNLLTTHQVAYLQDLHFSPMASSTALGLMLGMSIIGRLLCGVLGMRYEGRYLAMLFLGAMGLGVLALLNAVSVLFVYFYS